MPRHPRAVTIPGARAARRLPFPAELMKLLWDAIGTEFGGRHELYERNYAGSAEIIRMITLQLAQASGRTREWTGFAERCMAEYDLDGWTAPDLITPEDVNVFLRKPR